MPESYEKNFDRIEGAQPLPELRKGSRVYVDDAERSGEIACKREEPRSYNVLLDVGTIIRCNC